MHIKLFRTELGVVLYHYLGTQTVCDVECHVWDLVLETCEGELVCGRTCFQAEGPVGIDAAEACSDAAVLVAKHQRLDGLHFEE